ncbi:hypothetical protein BU25DRAFT_162877 [Macroventuria anomochaeta]|uniref:Uncharacterized protein n=1 Tax=Macroventuria anomochaeta TaxID=301207 RepID=A0ACB6RQV3_9PLEO|nr:uncharacterized protein BU25DRAFT_162877 [Macroventuria anomochaeta]KAF2624169.1 hypothetical protein BU25DRAFT_162877 [Macroventuria anomochaeta]
MVYSKCADAERSRIHFRNIDMDALEHESDWYRAMNPSGNVSTFVIETHDS